MFIAGYLAVNSCLVLPIKSRSPVCCTLKAFCFSPTHESEK
jgi:hypothetical protein